MTYGSTQAKLILQLRKVALSMRTMSRELGAALRKAREEKGIKVKDLAAYVGVQGPAISQWESGRSEPTSRNFTKACEYLAVDPAGLLPLFDQSPATIVLKDEPANLIGGIERMMAAAADHEVEFEEARPRPSFMRRRPQFQSQAQSSTILARDVPVFGIAVGGEDADFQFNGQEIDRVQRPIALANVADLFAVYLSNDSMYPAWREGSLMFVAPHRQPRTGDDVIIELVGSPDGGPGKAFLKRLKARKHSEIIVEQFNPPKEITFEAEEVLRILRVIPYEEALGIS